MPYVIEGAYVIRQEQLQRCSLVIDHNRNIPFIPFPLQERMPLSLDVLKKIGIYPQQGDLRIGGEVDYNIYIKRSQCAVLLPKRLLSIMIIMFLLLLFIKEGY